MSNSGSDRKEAEVHVSSGARQGAALKRDAGQASQSYESIRRLSRYQMPEFLLVR
jgi:hypothetical protein